MLEHDNSPEDTITAPQRMKRVRTFISNDVKKRLNMGRLNTYLIGEDI
jgi:hypothetical protein